VEVVASLSQGRTAAGQCGLFTHKSVPVIFEPPCIRQEGRQGFIDTASTLYVTEFSQFTVFCIHVLLFYSSLLSIGGALDDDVCSKLIFGKCHRTRDRLPGKDLKFENCSNSSIYQRYLMLTVLSYA